MKNFPVVVDGVTYWVSRSAAVVGFVFAKDKDGNWCVLANKRGEGCPDYNGCWNSPCGYLDYDESGEQAVAREMFEETGLDAEAAGINFEFDSVNTSPKSNRQNVTLRYWAVSEKTVEELSSMFSTAHMETNEVEAIKFVPIACINTLEWAFGHENLIKEVFNKHVPNA